MEIYRLISCGILRWLTMAGDLVQIVLVSLRSNNVDHLMERHFWVLLRVSCKVFAEDSVIRYLVIGHSGELSVTLLEVCQVPLGNEGQVFLVLLVSFDLICTTEVFFSSLLNVFAQR